jgi:nucleoside-triphosphatase THEP1
MSAASIWAISGPRQAGKSLFCRGVAVAARQAGWDVAGLLSPAQLEQGVKTGILVEDLRTGESRCLASIFRESPQDIHFGGWFFDPDALAWGNRVLEGSLPCDLLIVDELGPLELVHQMGWQAALEVLPRRQYRLALVVIRPELLSVGRSRLDISEVIEINSACSTDAWVDTWWHKIEEGAKHS